jgi:hypothetical protein
MVFVPHRKHTYRSPLPVAGTALLLYMYMMFIPHKKHTYGPPWNVTLIVLPVYMQMMFVPYRKHIYRSPLPVTEIALSYCLMLFHVCIKIREARNIHPSTCKISAYITDKIFDTHRRGIGLAHNELQ